MGWVCGQRSQWTQLTHDVVQYRMFTFPFPSPHLALISSESSTQYRTQVTAELVLRWEGICDDPCRSIVYSITSEITSITSHSPSPRIS